MNVFVEETESCTSFIDAETFLVCNDENEKLL